MIRVYGNIFHITNDKFSYSFYVKDGKLIHSYFGKAISPTDKTVMDSVVAEGMDRPLMRDCALYEMGESGRGDFRVPSVILRGQRGISTDFTYKGYEILNSKPGFGMPSLRKGGQTLKVTLADDVSGAELNLYYTVFENGFARRSEIKNTGDSPLVIDKLASVCLDFPQEEYDIIDLDGRWGGECGIHRARAYSGIKTFLSARGVSSHQHNPFVAVTEKNCNEETGCAVGFNLIYSGNFRIECAVDEQRRLRVNAGADIAQGGITLKAGKSFSSPEAVIVYSDEGLGGMSRNFHRLYRKHLINPKYADKIRPVVLNSWESCYFDFDEKKILGYIEEAKGLGIDIFVLDDGWFGHRDDDSSSLGDWFVDKRKLPHGLQPIIDCCKTNGMKFGIWFEPEAVNPDSELYRAHPDWAIKTEGRECVRMRNQFVLDFSKKEVVDNIFGQMSEILSAYDISYVKWDMNRALTDVVSAEKYIGYVQGVYCLYEKLSKAFPNVIIEGCSSGGGRFDAGILYYSPYIWTSDDTDAYERTRIQYGASLCYPLQTMSNHVSACPNHQTGRRTPFKTRGAVASMGCLGYELDITALGQEERAQIKEQIENYKRDADVILNGDLYRLKSPFEDGIFCMETVSSDKSKAYVAYVRGLNVCNMPLSRLKPKGLDPDTLYRVRELNKTASGAELMFGGINIDAYGEDFASSVLHIEKV